MSATFVFFFYQFSVKMSVAMAKLLTFHFIKLYSCDYIVIQLGPSLSILEMCCYNSNQEGFLLKHMYSLCFLQYPNKIHHVTTRMSQNRITMTHRKQILPDQGLQHWCSVPVSPYAEDFTSGKRLPIPITLTQRNVLPFLC